MLRKLILAGLVFVVSVLVTPTPVNAASVNGYLSDIVPATGVTMLLGCELAENSDGVLSDVCQSEENAQESLELYGAGTADGRLRNLSVWGSTRTLMGYMIDNPPANTQLYVASLQRDISPNNQAYAQGIGFSSLTPILSIWEAFRNIAYLAFVIAFMVVGFAIMFRAKLNPQTVVNLQLALPQMFITLLLVAFSYPIAGLLIDIMYVFTYLGIYVFAYSGFAGATDVGFLETIALNNNILANFFGLMIGQLGGRSADSVILTAGESMSALTADVLGFDNTIAQPITALLSVIGGSVVGVVFMLIFSIFFIFQMFRIFFTLLSSYIQVILLVIFSPLRLLLNMYPGSGAFTSWLKELAGHLAVFPITAFLFIITIMMIEGFNSTGSLGSGQGFTPPQLQVNGAAAVQAIIGLGMLMTIPNILDQVKAFFGIGGGPGGQGGGAGSFLGGAAFGGMLAPVKMAGGMAGNMYKGAAMNMIGMAYTGMDNSDGGFMNALKTVPKAVNPWSVYKHSQRQNKMARDEKEKQQTLTDAQLRNYGINPNTLDDSKENISKTYGENLSKKTALPFDDIPRFKNKSQKPPEKTDPNFSSGTDRGTD